MPIDFDLEALRKTHGCVNYFETGLWDPRTNVSSKKALMCGFDNVYCIEIRPDWVELGREIFKEEIEKGRYHLILDDSTNMRAHIGDTARGSAKGDTFDNKTMFFLDAHVDNSNIHNFKKRCPLFDELEAIGSLSRKDNIILIDDLRIITTPFPWGENSYGNVNFLQQIMYKIKGINSEYKFATLNGHVPDDVLIAYV